MSRIVSLTIVALPFIAISVAAQIATTTSLVGTVTDQSGRVIDGAAVTAVNTGTKDTYTTVTKIRDTTPSGSFALARTISPPRTPGSSPFAKPESRSISTRSSEAISRFRSAA